MTDQTQAPGAEASYADELREAVKPLVKHYEPWMDEYPDDGECYVCPRHTYGALRRVRALLSRPASAENKVEDADEELVHELRSFAKAYPEHIFVPLSQNERDAIKPSTISRISAEMGRHFAQFATKAADRIEALSPSARDTARGEAFEEAAKIAEQLGRGQALEVDGQPLRLLGSMMHDPVAAQRATAEAIAAALRQRASIPEPKREECLPSLVQEFLDAEDEVEAEARRAEANGGKGWSSAPVARRMYVVKALREAVRPLPSPPPQPNDDDNLPSPQTGGQQG